MRSVVVFAVAAIAIALFVPKLYSAGAPAAPPAALADPGDDRAAGPRSVTIRQGVNGHFQTEATIEGTRIAFMVDTGASVVALREGDAARLGIHPAEGDYTARISTANGMVKAARVALSRVDVGDISVRDVTAVVLPDAALGQNLLGMSFLSRTRWAQQNGRLVLEQ